MTVRVIHGDCAPAFEVFAVLGGFATALSVKVSEFAALQYQKDDFRASLQCNGQTPISAELFGRHLGDLRAIRPITRANTHHSRASRGPTYYDIAAEVFELSGRQLDDSDGLPSFSPPTETARRRGYCPLKQFLFCAAKATEK